MTTNNSVSWNTYAVNLSGNYTSAIAFHTNKLLGIVSTSSSMPYIARTTDCGQSWTQINIGSGLTGTTYISWIPNTSVVYILGSNGAIKKSTDNGINWNLMTVPPVSGILHHFDFTRAGNIIYGYGISTGGSVIKLMDTSIVVKVSYKNSNVVSSINLSENYPNPFNPITNFYVYLPQKSFVNISVFNIMGEQVSVITNNYLDAGMHDYILGWIASAFRNLLSSFNN